jgi:transcriptional regulator with XRE-family HTH domain
VFLLNPVSSIRTYLQDFLDKNQYTMNKFADTIQMNVGALSNIISGKRSISVKQLDQITAGMNLQEGYFYHLYIMENFNQQTMDWRRLGPLLLRCAELNKLEEIKQILRLTLENLNYIPLLFDMAEHFYIQKQKEVAILLYQSIAESERNQHSERLALCQYRLFTLRLNNDMENNLLLVTQFEPYVERLEESYHLDAIKSVLNINTSLARWDKVKLNAENLLEKASKQYKLFGRDEGNQINDKPLIFYILYSYLSMSDVYFQLEQYEQSLEYVKKYTDVQWVSEPDSEEQAVLQQFQVWAHANNLLCQLMLGHIEVLPEYVKYISTRESEQFLGIGYIIMAANKYQLEIDHILDRFDLKFIYEKQITSNYKVNDQLTLERYTNFLRELGIYYLNKGQLDIGIRYIIDSLEYAIKINNKSKKLKCITAIFEISLQHEDYITNQSFKNLMSDVLEISKKS